MLTECRWWHANTGLRLRPLHWSVDHLDRPTLWVVYLLDHVSSFDYVL